MGGMEGFEAIPSSEIQQECPRRDAVEDGILVSHDNMFYQWRQLKMVAENCGTGVKRGSKAGPRISGNRSETESQQFSFYGIRYGRIGAVLKPK